MKKYNKQIVILETEEGIAQSKRILKEVWKMRLKQVAPHYKVKKVEIIRKLNQNEQRTNYS